jgi:hypothetical protein
MSLTKKKIQSALDAFIKENNKKSKEQDAKLEVNPDLEFDKYYFTMSEESIDGIYDATPFEAKGVRFDSEESIAGFEGGGDTCSRIFKVTDLASSDEKYIKFDGWYSSYEGSNYDGFYFADYDLVQVKKWKKGKQS